MRRTSRYIGNRGLSTSSIGIARSYLAGRVELSGGGSRFDSDVDAFLSARSIHDALIGTALDTAAYAMKAIPFWYRAKAFWPIVGSTAGQQCGNLIARGANTDASNRLTFHGGITHASTGVTGDGTTGYIKTFIDLHEDVPAQHLSMGAYVRSCTIGAGDEMLMGAGTAFSGPHIDFYNTDDVNVALSQNGAGGSPVVLTETSMSSYTRLVNMSCYGRNHLALYRHGVQESLQSAARYGYFPSGGTAAQRQLYLLASNGNGTAQNFFGGEICCAYVSSSLDAATVLDLANIVHAIQVTLGREVA